MKKFLAIAFVSIATISGAVIAEECDLSAYHDPYNPIHTNYFFSPQWGTHKLSVSGAMDFICSGELKYNSCKGCQVTNFQRRKIGTENWSMPIGGWQKNINLGCKSYKYEHVYDDIFPVDPDYIYLVEYAVRASPCNEAGIVIYHFSEEFEVE